MSRFPDAPGGRRGGAFALLALTVLVAGVMLAVPAAGAANGCGLEGAFRIYSSYIGYKTGGGGAGPSSTRQLTLSGASWQFGSSSGTFSVAPITAADWQRWGTHPYGPTRKIVLSGWNGGAADGEIEGQGVAVNFFWVIYSVPKSELNPAATVKLKFGHAIPPHGCGGSSGSPSGNARISITPAVISAGQTVHVTGTGFQPNERIAMTETYTLRGAPQTSILGDGSAEANGTVRFDHDTFPGTTPAGVHTICGVGAYSKARACGTFTVTARSGGTGGSSGSDGSAGSGSSVPVGSTPGVPKVK